MLTQFLSIPLIMYVILLVVPTLSPFYWSNSMNVPFLIATLQFHAPSWSWIIRLKTYPSVSSRNESSLSLFETIEHLLKWKIKIKLEKDDERFDLIWFEKVRLIVWVLKLRTRVWKKKDEMNISECRSYSVGSIEFC